MGAHRGDFDLNGIVDNVTRPTDAAHQVNGAANPAYAAAADESEAIDITIDEEDHKKVFGSQSDVPLGLAPRSQIKQDTSLAPTTTTVTDVLPSSPPPSYDHASQMIANGDTAPRTYHFLLPTALHESGLLFNPQLSQSKVSIERNPVPDAQSGADPLSQDSSFTAATSSSPDSAPTPTVAQIEACKPHPEALFVAETLEWRLILDSHRMYRIPPAPFSQHNASELHEACDLVPGSVYMYETEPVSIPAHDQRHPVQLLEHWDPAKPHAPLPVLEDFNSHRCYLTGNHLLSSPPDSIVSVVDRQLLMRFKENRENDPAVGLTGPESFIRALRVLLRVIGNYVHGERRGAPTTSLSLAQKLGWDQLSRQIFHSLGWKESAMADGRNAIVPPPPTTSASATTSFDADMVLRRNTRAWIELSVWLTFHVDQLRNNRPASAIIHAQDKSAASRVEVHPVSESLLDMIGLRQDQLDQTYRRDLPTTTHEALYTLGASSTTRDQLVKFAYLVNMQANQGRRALELFAALKQVYESQRRTSRVLEELIAYEQSQGRYCPRDVDQAYERLHLGAAHLGPDVERESIPIDLIVDNYKARAREVLINSDASEHAAVKDALRIITLHLGKPDRLVQALDEDVDMDIDQACRMLDTNPDMDDSTVLAIFDLYVADAPARRDALRHALRAIAEHRNSEYLRHFLRTGEKDATVAETWQQLPSNDLPAGIDNIGNTCYLNSVLQYFFSITEVRNRVLQAASTLHDSTQADQLAFDAERRVGGQRITSREMQRSKRFVGQLGGLFHHLIHANALSVRPERELAYLALVSSRAEDLEAELNPISEANAPPKAADDVTEDQAAPTLSSDPGAIEDTIDTATVAASADLMDTTADEPGATHVEASTAPASTVTHSAPPPLPPRPARQATATDSTSAALPPPARRNSLMQLGAQQDVSECLDNCMFQLEVALAVSGEAESSLESPAEHKMDVDGSEEAKPTTDEVNGQVHDDLLTSLFLGKTCQRVEADTMPMANHSSSEADGSLSRPAQPQKQPSTHIKHEVFKILPIDVLEEGRDIYDGFDGFFDSDTFVATSGAVQRRSVTLLSAPPLLQIQLQRVQYDRVTMRAFKSQAHLDMPETLYVDRYMDFDVTDSANAARVAKRLDYQAKRKRIEELRAKLAACKDSGNFHLTQTLSQAANAVEELARLPSLADVAAQLEEMRKESKQAEMVDAVPLPSQSEASQQTSSSAEVPADEVESSLPPPLSTLIDPGLAKLLRDEGKLLREEVKQAQEEIETLKTEMASIWADERRFSYRLVAVFMHRGEASHGHYFLNLRGGGEESKWYKFNDSAVSETSLDQVLRDRSGATPYLVTYVREDYVHLIDPICRLIEVEQAQAGQESQEQQQHEDSRQSVMEVDASTMQDAAAAKWDSAVVAEGETKQDGANGAEAGRPQIITEALKDVGGEAGNGIESPIKRARTDNL
ncbi:related to UBP2-ubiquitin-specific proteinase [Sporisorium reilianum f. sp. reilianum]|uniref:ubiquitinyl hydrolase 1 n=1 Tax=Sporisorium reilianum f. sp. reilianum TaxID=72559 RepID=A0A2N8UEB4_9BASI|nr:related to UBP2-ubiquitin-specific proteinase [Sporisorium reilianum f. sp. reilianum]